LALLSIAVKTGLSLRTVGSQIYGRVHSFHESSAKKNMPKMRSLI